MTEALATRARTDMIPAHLRDDAETLAATSMDFPGDDLVLPRLSIAQSLTPQLKKNNDRYMAGLNSARSS